MVVSIGYLHVERLMNTLYETLKSNNDLLDITDPSGWVGRVCNSDLAYAKFLDYVKESKRDLDLVTVSLELTAVHQILHIDLGVFNKKLTEDQRRRCTALIMAISRLGLMELLTDGAKKKVLKEIKKLAALL